MSAAACGQLHSSRHDFLEMTLCMYLIPVFDLCLCRAFVMHYDSYHRARLYERKW